MLEIYFFSQLEEYINHHLFFFKSDFELTQIVVISIRNKYFFCKYGTVYIYSREGMEFTLLSPNPLGTFLWSEKFSILFLLECILF